LFDLPCSFLLPFRSGSVGDLESVFFHLPLSRFVVLFSGPTGVRRPAAFFEKDPLPVLYAQEASPRFSSSSSHGAVHNGQNFHCARRFCQARNPLCKLDIHSWLTPQPLSPQGCNFTLSTDSVLVVQPQLFGQFFLMV